MIIIEIDKRYSNLKFGFISCFSALDNSCFIKLCARDPTQVRGCLFLKVEDQNRTWDEIKDISFFYRDISNPVLWQNHDDGLCILSEVALEDIFGSENVNVNLQNPSRYIKDGMLKIQLTFGEIEKSIVHESVDFALVWQENVIRQLRTALVTIDEELLNNSCIEFSW